MKIDRHYTEQEELLKLLSLPDKDTLLNEQILYYLDLLNNTTIKLDDIFNAVNQYFYDKYGLLPPSLSAANEIS